MTEGLMNIPEEVRKALPLTAEELAKYRIINRGEVQVSLVKEQESVLHIALPLPVISEDEAVITNRWLYEDKGRKIQGLQAAIPRGIVDVPEVKDAGILQLEGKSFSYWLESFIPGISLTQATLEGLSLDVYTKIIEWLVDYHTKTQGDASLSDYYHDRFNSLLRVFSSPSVQSQIEDRNLKGIKETIGIVQSFIDTDVGENEKVSRVHGDLRADNILINQAAIGVIDFEQGVNGGDWYADIEKLLLLSRDEKPDLAKPDRYRPPLEISNKVALLDKYLTQRKSRGLIPAKSIEAAAVLQERQKLANRTTLFDTDNTLSSLTYRLIRQRQTGQEDDSSILRLINEANRINNRLKK